MTLNHFVVSTSVWLSVLLSYMKRPRVSAPHAAVQHHTKWMTAVPGTGRHRRDGSEQNAAEIEPHFVWITR